ncbi:MAG: peptide-methionine (S)-S-oxide reductase MsrA, partial [Ghiorsea sp.]|nr:peptide-methionine (S)-S-oxide reductase MsrA [Ghiorsea sp.]
MNKITIFSTALLTGAVLMLTLPMLTSAKDKMANESAMENMQPDNMMGSEKAIFAGGCFWCMEKPFEKLSGVSSVVSGYSTGKTSNPTYRNYMSGGHLEVVEITYNPKKVSYEKLLAVFWHQINPTDAGGQFVDRGYAYSSGIFYVNEKQRKLAEVSKANMEVSKVFGKPIVTPIKAASTFYAAEDYHQDYYKKNFVCYWYYCKGSGRDQYLDKIWGKDRGEHKKMTNLKDNLTPLQY